MHIHMPTMHGCCMHVGTQTFEPSVEDTGHTNLSDTPVNMVTRR